MLFGLRLLDMVLGSGSSVPLGVGKHEMLGDLVEATYYILSSDIAVVFHLVGNHLCFCIVLFISDMLLMPLNCLYCADYVVASGA